jgi:hypothetical protein
MLHSWTGIDIRGPAPALSQLTSPENGIFMNDLDHIQFGSFLFYFDKVEEDPDPDTPHKYKVRMARPDALLANGEETADVEFLADNSSNTEVPPPPDPRLLGVHAAFAKVLARSGVAAYMERVEMDNERGATTGSGMPQVDFAALLSSRLLAS